MGAKIGRCAERGLVIAFTGGLGAGKTTMCKGIALGLAIAETVTSPTYTIVNEYKGRMPLYHFDAYRLSSADEMLDVGCDTYFFGDGVSVVEWSERAASVLPQDALHIDIQILPSGVRCVRIEGAAFEAALSEAVV